MKKKILNALMKNIQKNNSKLNEEQLEIIKYGLESIYLSITKLTVILTLAIILNIFKETIYVIIFYNVIRFCAFGMHANNSISCLITSTILFIGGALIGIYFNFSLITKIIVSAICLTLIIIYAPADTVKHPLLKASKRKKLKIKSSIISLILSLFIVYFHENNITNFMLIGYIEAAIMILPVTYKLYGLPYNNYKNYGSI